MLDVPELRPGEPGGARFCNACATPLGGTGSELRPVFLRLWAPAADIVQKIGERENAACAQLLAAAKLVADRRPDAAAQLLDAAPQFFRSVGASHWLSEIDALLPTGASAE